MIEFATVARPYAKALFELAEERKQTDIWLGYLEQLAWLMDQPRVVAFVNQAKFDAEQKAAELLRLLDCAETNSGKEFQNFVRIVAEEKRLEALPDIYQQYDNLVLGKSKTRKAVIYTAYDVVGEGQQAKIISDLEQRFNVCLRATFITDPNLIGGVKVVVGDQVLDLSVQGKLKQLYATMTTN